MKNKQALLLPLKHYDELGRVKPHWLLWLCLLFLCRGYFVAVASTTNMSNRELLLGVFYPDHQYFYFSLAIGVPALICAGLVSYRDKLWAKGWFRWPAACKPLMVLGLCADLLLHLLMSGHQHWRFSWLLSGTIWLDGIWLLYVLRSQYLKVMLQDWRKNLG